MKQSIRAAVILLLLCLSVMGVGFTQQHHDAAQRLLELTLPLKDAEISRVAFERIAASRPDLADRESEIRGMIDDFLSSPDYLETGAQAVMRYFSEPELQEMNRALERDGLFGTPDEQAKLLVKYNRLLDKVEEMLVGYFSRKMKSHPPVVKDSSQ